MKVVISKISLIVTLLIIILLVLTMLFISERTKFDKFSTTEKTANQIILAAQQNKPRDIGFAHCGILTPTEPSRKILDSAFYDFYWPEAQKLDWKNAIYQADPVKPNVFNIVGIVDKDGKSVVKKFESQDVYARTLLLTKVTYRCFGILNETYAFENARAKVGQ